jgi:hypothetical protein
MVSLPPEGGKGLFFSSSAFSWAEARAWETLPLSSTSEEPVSNMLAMANMAMEMMEAAVRTSTRLKPPSKPAERGLPTP